MKTIRKIYKIIEFVIFYLIKLIEANFQLAYYILRPKFNMKPGIIKTPLNLTNNQAILLYVNLISMTPGSFTIDMTDDKKYIYIHFLFFSNEQKMIAEIKRLENKVSELFK